MTKHLRSFILLCIPVMFCVLAVTDGIAQQNAEAPAADWVLTNGKIYTVDPGKPWAEAVVIRDGDFVYVGDNAGAERYISAGIETTDLGGRMVIPGIVDSHTHPGLIGVEQYNANIDAKDREDFFAQLTAWAKENPGDGWVRGTCWPNEAFVDGDKGPDRADLDAIFPDRPVWIASCMWHSYWLNTKAMEVLGIDDEIEDPSFPVAMYKRDDAGRLTGWVKEGAGWQYGPQVFGFPEEIHQRRVRAMLRELSAHGVTTLYDAGNLRFADHVYAFIARLEAAGELPVRYEATYMITIPKDRARAVAEMKRYRETYGGKLLQFNTVKLFMDGIHEDRTAAMLEPYADNPNHVSDTTLSVEELRDFLIELHKEEFDLHVHVIGDLAVKSVLDAVEQARAAIGDDFYPRVSMGHLQNIDPADWARFGELGVGANFTPSWHGHDRDDTVAVGLGPERNNDTYRAKALLDRGANVTFSSDTWGLASISPYLGMQNGHTRQYPKEQLEEGDDPELFRQPESEKLSLEILLKGYTINGAYQLRMEDRIGSIEAGKSADLVVLDQNLFEVDPYTLHTIKPDAVIMEGKTIRGNLD